MPKQNTIHERACFHRRTQKDEETVDAFIPNPYKLAEHCEFGLQRDEQIRDRIVIGILDKSLLQKLQMKSDLNLDRAIQMARQSEQVKVQVAGQVDNKHLGEVNQKNWRPNANRRQSPTQRGRNFRQPGGPLIQLCSRYIRAHKPDETCLATGAKCSKCKKKGHFTVVCPSVVGEVTHAPQETNQHFFLGAIKSGDSGKEP